MATSNCPSLDPRDSLRHDDLVPVPTGGTGLVFRIVLTALAALLVVILGSLPIETQGRDARLEHLAAPGTAPPPAFVLDRHGSQEDSAP